MGYIERKKLFAEVERLRERPLITYVTSLRPGMNVQMAGDAIRPFIDQIEAISKDYKTIDVLIISNGGDPITSLRIMETNINSSLSIYKNSPLYSIGNLLLTRRR